MEVKEFVEETSKIEKYYGKELDEFQRKVWFQELKTIDIKRYRQITREIYRQCKFMPKLSDILDIQNELPYAQKQKNISYVECQKCNSRGFKLYTKRIKNGNQDLEYTYVARCDCVNGQEFAYDGTKVIDTQHRSKFYVPTIQQINV